jgi:arylsulfatase A-like enzyme
MHYVAKLVLIVAIAFSCPMLDARAQARRPNIVVIVADDMGYADVGMHGSKDIPTPNIDALAKSGVRFTDAYVSGPYCSPTRAGLLTGRYPQRFGHEFNILMIEAHRDAGLPLSETTLADRLKAAGYRTAVIGKWHLGAAPQFHPLRRGFDEFFGFLAAGHSYLNPGADTNPLLDGNTVVRETRYLTDEFSDRAVSFISRQKSKPFFLYLAFNAVHVPMQATDKYLRRFQQIADTTRRTYAAMLSAMDDGIGRTLEALRARGLEENTLIFFFSDNGGPTTVGGINGSSNKPLRGSKRTTWEGGIRVPFVVSWKGRVAANTTYSQPIIQLDIAPTALAAAGVAADPKANFDGVNLLPFLTSPPTAVPHATLYWRLGAMMAIRKGDWKLVKMPDQPDEGRPEELSDLTGAQLYNLKTDIAEQSDVAAVHPEKVRELENEWRGWNRQLSKPAWPSPVRLRSPRP